MIKTHQQQITNSINEMYEIGYLQFDNGWL